MEQNIKKLPEYMQLKGTGIPGLTAQLVRRSDQVAWYLRNDGYHEVFLIKTGKTFDGIGLMEYYPGTDAFGITAWCTRSEETAARLFANLILGSSVSERLSNKRCSDTTGGRKHKIRRSQAFIQYDWLVQLGLFFLLFVKFLN